MRLWNERVYGICILSFKSKNQVLCPSQHVIIDPVNYNSAITKFTSEWGKNI